MILRLFLDIIFVVIYTKNMRLRLILDAKLVAIYTKKRKIATSWALFSLQNLAGLMDGRDASSRY